MSSIARFIWVWTVVVVTLLCTTPSHAQSGPRLLAQLLDQGPQDIAFVEATSQTLLRSGQVDFATAIELDVNANSQVLTLDAFLSQGRHAAPRFAIVLDVVEARTSRRVLSLTDKPSFVFLGFSGQPLSVPADDPARRAQGFAEINRAPPVQAFGSQPAAMGQPIQLSYAYQQATILVQKRMTAYAYVVDRQAQTYVKTTIDAVEQERFEVAYGVSNFDPKANHIRDQLDTEEVVRTYEDFDLLIKLSDIINDAQDKADSARSYTSPVVFRKMLLAQQNKTLTSLAANRFDARPLNDPRFDSVVAVYTGNGALGSGFYVTPDVIMTNWHVVQDHPFVEFKLYDGRESFGTVLGKDARLDIALVRVEHRGRPVAFMTGRTLDVGTQVDAIGHPKGFEFSITRGVVSAVRPHYSINLPKGAGEDVLYVQTDAPINPGNSGGPLFLGERVVGMNTWGRIDGQSLGFSIHYSQLLRFLNEHLPGFHVDPAKGG